MAAPFIPAPDSADLTSLPAHLVARRIRAREISASAVVDAYFARIAAINPQLNAITDLDADGARAQASAVDDALANGRPVGRLAGVPLTIKSSLDVRGLRAECGSLFRQGRVAEQDAVLVSRLRKAGAVILGVTNTPDMLMGYETDNHLYGRTNSPLAEGRTPGGSSGGESAAIAGRLSAGGFGSDGGGSIRVPCHYCGLFGLKPTPGVIPRTGHWPPSMGPGSFFGLVGPMARSAEDLQLLLEATAGPDLVDPYAAPVPVAPPTDEELSGARIGVVEEVPGFPVTPETRASVREAAARLEAQGFRTEVVQLPEFAAAVDVWEIVFRVGGYTATRALVADREQDVHPLSNVLFGTREQADALTYPDHLAALVERDRLRARFLEPLAGCRAILCPVASIPAPLHGEREWTIDGQVVPYPRVFAYSQVFNLTSQPAATAPVGVSPEGLPIGVQIVGRHYDDAAMIALAQRVAGR